MPPGLIRPRKSADVDDTLLASPVATLNETGLTIDQGPISTNDLAQLIQRIHDNTISARTAKEVFAALWAQEGSVDAIIAAKGLTQISDSYALEKIIADIVAKNPEQAEQYRLGKEKVFSFFVGQVMKATQGKGNPTQVNALLKTKLSP